jgi:hypothetical protein
MWNEGEKREESNGRPKERSYKRKHRNHLPVLDLCFQEPDKSTRVCHDAYSQPCFGARRGNATRQCMQKKSFDVSFAMMAG